MKQNVKKNYIYNLIYQVVAIILPIISTPYISKVLGAKNIGIYGYTLSISAYFVLFGTLGMTLYGQREIAYLQKEKGKYSKAFFKAAYFSLRDKFVAEPKVEDVTPLVNAEFEEMLESLNKNSKVIDFQIAS